MIISIASGKGGTGKTTVAVNLAYLMQNVQLVDCDVEEPNAHLFLKPVIEHKEKAFVLVPRVNYDKCNYCGKCMKVCAYGAISVLPATGKGSKGQVLIFDHLCHSCGACVLLCQQNAMFFEKREIGIIEIGKAGKINFVHGKLNIGDIMTPSLIKQVKRYINNANTVIIDAPPGTSCPVINAIKGSDYVLLVTEPTPSGLHDLKLAVEALKKMKIQHGIIINRSENKDEIIEEYCKKEKLNIVLKIPFTKEAAEIYSKGNLLVIESPKYRKLFEEFINTFIKSINKGEKYEKPI